MRVIENNSQPITVCIVCCVHGDEVFGLRVFEYFQNQIEKFPGVKIVLAHEQAVRQAVRFIEKDLNRSFPGAKDGCVEERLALQLMRQVHGMQYVIDIHTTRSDIKMTPIISAMNRDVDTILNLCSSQEVVLMPRRFSQSALIGQVYAGVSLEFNQEYAKQPASLHKVVRMVQGLITKTKKPKRSREVFMINDKLGMDIVLPPGSRNFAYISELGIYPFLLGENSYTDFQCFSAKNKIQLVI